MVVFKEILPDTFVAGRLLARFLQFASSLLEEIRVRQQRFEGCQLLLAIRDDADISLRERLADCRLHRIEDDLSVLVLEQLGEQRAVTCDDAKHRVRQRNPYERLYEVDQLPEVVMAGVGIDGRLDDSCSRVCIDCVVSRLLAELGLVLLPEADSWREAVVLFDQCDLAERADSGRSSSTKSVISVFRFVSKK